MLWIGLVLLPQDGFRKAPTTALCSIVDQLDTARRFIWNEVTRAKCLWSQTASIILFGGIRMVCVGIDVAKDKHDCFIMSSEGEVLADVFTIPNNMDGFELLLERIRSCSPCNGKIKVGLEATGHYSLSILGFLINCGLPTYVINPLLTNQYRKVKSLRKTKTDRIDARTIAAMLLSDVGLTPYTNTSYHNEELKSLTRYRFAKVQERARLKTSISRLVNILFPELEPLVPTLYTASVFALLSELPGASYVATCHLTRLTHLLYEASKGRYDRQKALEIREAAKSSIGSVMPAKSLELKHTIALIQVLDAEIEEVECEIQRIMDTINSPITTIPGINFRMGSMILAEIGDFSRFESADQILAYAGLSPSIYQSGQLTSTYARMEKRGSKYLRYALFNAAIYVCHWDPAFKAYLAKKRAEGKHYYVAVSHAVKKLVRLIFAMQTSGRAYCPAA